MTFILKTTEHAGASSPVGSDNEHCLYADIVSISFRREVGGAATAHCYLREPVKTADVPGFVEVEKYISFTGCAYVMNENGKTVSMFTANASGSPAIPHQHRTHGEYTDGDLIEMPYAEAALLRRNARRSGDAILVARLDQLKVAVDA
jgi:hypothetical protein